MVRNVITHEILTGDLDRDFSFYLVIKKLFFNDVAKLFLKIIRSIERTHKIKLKKLYHQDQSKSLCGAVESLFS